MKQAVLKQQGVPAIADVQGDLALRVDEVFVGVKVAMICGSDLSYFQAETLPHDLRYPLVLGHEMASVVKEIGTAVSGTQKGNYVAVEPQSYCGHCETCQGGDYNSCELL